MTLAIVVLVVGLSCSAFFSGTETGLFRVPRVRLVLDGLAGSRVARGLLRLVNQPALFVATALIGNNVANYLVSLGTVLVVQQWMQGPTQWAELLLPIVTTPVVFVVGELLPKTLFYYAPYRLLRIVGPLLLLATVILLPIAGLVGGIARLLSMLTGETPLRVRMAMARRELRELLKEGHAAGLLGRHQRTIAENVWEVGSAMAIAFAMPVDRLASIPSHGNRKQAIAAARQKGHALIVARAASGTIEGYYRLSDLLVSDDPTCGTPLPASFLPSSSVHIAALVKLVDMGTELAVLVDRSGRPAAIVTRSQLTESLLTPRDE
jgi:putative hemolysin